MALPPRFSAQSLPPGPTPPSAHTLELYLDYVCPFSAKMWATLTTSIFPQLQTRYASRVRFILRQQIQPWHPSSTLVHEAALAVLRVAPDKYVEFSTRLFERQEEFFDESVVREGRNETYERLAGLAKEVGVDREKVLDLLEVGEAEEGEGGSNAGNWVTGDVKFIVKTARLTGVHVTPTVLFDGAVENGISSSFTGDQWIEWLNKNLD